MRIETFTKRRGSGWPLSMHVLEIEPGKTLIHAPIWIDETAAEKVAALGEPSLLFAPNHYHHLSLPKFRERFATAKAVAARAAIPRLESKGHAGLRAVEDTELPAGARWLVPEGTKSGEAWLSIDGEGGPTWIVCDGFFHENAPVGGVEGFVLRMLNTTPGLCVGSTFTMMCVADDRRYARWVLDAIEREKPARVLFSHGDPLEAPAEKLAEVVRRRFRA